MEKKNRDTNRSEKRKIENKNCWKIEDNRYKFASCVDGKEKYRKAKVEDKKTEQNSWLFTQKESYFQCVETGNVSWTRSSSATTRLRWVLARSGHYSSHKWAYCGASCSKSKMFSH